MRLLAEGLWPAEVARRVGVTRQSFLRWTRLKEKGGVEALKRPDRFGRPPKLDEAQRAELIKTPKAGAMAGRFCERVMDVAAHRPLGQGAIRNRTVATFSLAHVATTWLECTAAHGPSAPARRGGNQYLERKAVASGSR